MKYISRICLSLIIPILISCGMTSDPFYFSETEFDDLILRVCRNDNVYHTDFDELILPEASRLINVENLDKWLFGDIYLQSLDQFSGTPEVTGNVSNNEWGSSLWVNRAGRTSEIVRNVRGITDDRVAAVFKIEDSSDPLNGYYHVYRYHPWQADISSLDLNIWFGPAHVYYQNLVRGDIESGAPYMELFPVDSSAGSKTKEVRIEKTSFFKFRELHGGDWADDWGSFQSKMFSVLGQPDSIIPLTTQDNIDWNSRNTLFTYPLGDSIKGGYIHYNIQDDVKVRVFLGACVGEELRILSMYFVQS